MSAIKNRNGDVVTGAKEINEVFDQAIQMDEIITEQEGRNAISSLKVG